MITLQTLPQATAQQVFDQVANHLLSQKKKSEFKGECVYLTPTGMSCAAGCLISKEEYSGVFEGITWNGLVRRGIVPDEHQELILNLQEVHDLSNSCDWKHRLAIVADDHNLNKDVLNNYKD